MACSSMCLCQRVHDILVGQCPIRNDSTCSLLRRLPHDFQAGCFAIGERRLIQLAVFQHTFLQAFESPCQLVAVRATFCTDMMLALSTLCVKYAAFIDGIDERSIIERELDFILPADYRRGAPVNSLENDHTFSALFRSFTKWHVQTSTCCWQCCFHRRKPAVLWATWRRWADARSTVICSFDLS